MEYQLVKNKRIAVIANFDFGLYKFRKALLEQLIKDGNEVYILLPNGEFVDRLVEMGCRFIETPIERRGMNPLKDISLYRLYKIILKEIRPDLVITYTVKPNVYGGFACRMLKIPYAANITGLGSAIEGGGVLRKLVLTMYRTALKKARIVFFENEGNRQMIVDSGTVRAEQTYVLHGAGIDTDEYELSDYPDDGATKFLYVGRIMKEKGVDELFSSMERLKEGLGEKVELHVVGMFEEAYERKITELQGQGILQFHGFQENIKPFYSASHCIVLPSWHEGMSNVLLEAGSMGRPLITSNIHGCLEAVADGESGMLFEVRNEDSLYEKMRQFVEMTYESKKKMALASREHICNYFDKRQVVSDTITHLQ